MSRYTAPIKRVDTAKGHYYKDATGQRVPGVTTIIDKGMPKPALINWAANATADYAVDHWDELTSLGPAVRLKTLQSARYEAKDAAARRGTEVHRAAELLIAGKAVQVPDEIAGYVDAYVRFLDEFDVEAIAVEFTAISYRWGYAGTADLYAWVTLPDKGRVRMLLDVKTTRSGIFGEVALQLAGYRYADAWDIGDGEIDPMEIDYCGGIHVRPDGYSLIPVEAGEQEHKALLYAQQVGMFAEGSRDLVGAAIMPPHTSTYTLTRSEDL